MTSMSLIGVILSVILLYVSRKVVAYRRALSSVGYHPGPRFLFARASIPGFLLPRIKYISQGYRFAFQDKHNGFAEHGYDVLTKIVCIPEVKIMVTLADPIAIKEVTSARTHFPKPIKSYRPLAFWGPNLVVSEGDLWKKYRKITAPAFSDRNNRLVWEETSKIVQSLIDDVWGGRNRITVNHCLDITLPIALFVIGAAGFGKRIAWLDDDAPPAGHMMTFKKSLHIVTKDFAIKLLAPKWVLNLGLIQRLRNVKDGFDELHRYMKEMIRERQHSEKVERDDLLSTLLGANDDSEDENVLTEDELISNIYVFLVAGHETTAHTLCFALALLALYPDEQDKLYNHIQAILPDGRSATYDDMPLLTRVLAVLYETLRLFPPVGGIPKIAEEDTTISTVNEHGERVVVPIPKGCDIVIQVPALHYNPRYWKDPHSFNPQRFLEDWPRDAFMPFSGGPRACIGRKFSETESIATLTLLVSKFRISVQEEPRFAGETFEQRKNRIFALTVGLTLTPSRVPLLFTRRN